MSYVMVILNGQLEEATTDMVVGRHDVKRNLDINGRIIILKWVIKN